MTHITAMKLALDALQSNRLGDGQAAIAALTAALAESSAEQPPIDELNHDEVICPKCVTSFRAIPWNVQKLMLGAGFEPPFTHPPVTDIERKDAALRKALSMIEVMKKIIHKGKATRGAAVIDAAVTSIKEALS